MLKIREIIENKYNSFVKKYEKESWFKELKLLPETISMVKDYVRGRYKKLPVKTILAISFGFGYCLSPIDVIPDFIPVVGKLDDLGVLKAMLLFIKKDVIEYMQWKKQNQVLIG